MPSLSCKHPGNLEEVVAQLKELEQRVAAYEKREKQWRRRERAWRKREKELLEKIQEAERKGKRSATPFSKGKSKKNPKKPGRKPGHPPAGRPAPAPTEPPILVRQQKEQCGCGGCLELSHTERVTITDPPEIPKPIVKAYDVEVWVCEHCGAKVRGQHEDVAKDQYGATAHRVGPRGRAMAHVLHYGLGLTVRKTPQVLKATMGLDYTQGAITQDALRQQRGPVGAAYGALRACVKEAANVHTDDTGWKVNGQPAQMMVFETTGPDPVVVYQVRNQHRNEEVREVIPGDYKGVMTTDRGKSYDAAELKEVKQNKCVDHLKRNIKSAQEKQHAGARSFGNRLLKLIYEAESLWRRFHADELTLDSYKALGEVLLDQLDACLNERALTDPENMRILKGCAEQHKLGHLLRFLEDPKIEPSNNRAERALRLSVIIRKVSHCSKNEKGAEAQAGYQSVLATLARRGIDMVEGLTSLFKGKNPFSKTPQSAPT